MNPTEISDALEGLAARPFDREEFPFEFASATGNAKATVSKLRPGKRCLNRSRIPSAVLLNRKFYYAPAKAGELDNVLDRLREDRATARHRPAVLIATDGVDLVAEHPDTGETLRCPYAEMHRHFGFFLPAAGMTRYKAAEENEIDIKATGKLARLYDTLLRKNLEWKDEARRHDLNQFMTRLVFCFFAEDVGIFPKDQFTRLIVNHAGENGAEAHLAIIHAFKAMNRPRNSRDSLPGWTRELDYVNGGLFADRIDCPTFDKIAWGYFQDAARLDWREINPDIFGSMIQSIADPKARGELGMHYTSVPNILKVLAPLFLDDLDAAIEKAWDRPNALKKVLDRLGRIHVFDPACGSGNFLVVAYRQLREREMRILARLGELTGQTQMRIWSSISLANFHGIEITDFGAETAKLALFIAEYQSNAAMSEMFGAAAEALPLRDGGHVICGNALRLDWNSVCPPTGGDEEVYIAGNPPFLGARNQSTEQKKDQANVFSGILPKFKALDMVSCWFFRAAQFMQGRKVQAAFVATNSICQGQSVSMLWPYVLKEGVEIGFAYTSFQWRNNAAKKATVTCVIIGLRNSSSMKKRLFAEGVERQVSNINAYLVDAPQIIVYPSSKPLFELPAMDYGNYPGDGGHLSLSAEEAEILVQNRPEAARFIRPVFGAQEFLNGIDRKVIWITESDVDEAQKIPEIAARIERVRETREGSRDPGYNALARVPFRYRDTRAAKRNAILVPTVSSERREFLPCDIKSAPAVTTNQAFNLLDVDPWVFALLGSRLHLAWCFAVCGKHESRLRYSSTLGWNTFPVPRFTEAQLEALNASARAILKTRYLHHPRTIAELYDPDKMPDDLREVHRRNDELLEGMYIGRPFRNDTERLEKLFKLYAARIEKLKTEVA